MEERTVSDNVTSILVDTLHVSVFISGNQRITFVQSNALLILYEVTLYQVCYIILKAYIMLTKW